MGLLNWLKNNVVAITSVAAILTIFSLAGFNLNVPGYYNSLTTEGKIIFVLIFNTLLTIVLFSVTITKKHKK